jgi:DNA polymerase-3 subunit alpha
MLRRAMGKKNAVEMAKNRDIFVKGAIEREVEGDLAGKIFDQMESFANYGFNKSHAAAYALVSYQTAWLKAHYPAEFMAAVLSCEMQDTEFLVSLLDECKRMKLSVVAPDVNRCFLRFSVEKGAVLYGLAAIKGVGEGAVRHVVEVRGRTPFQDLFDFCQRIDTRRVNKKVLEGLIFSGAMDGFGQTRATLHKTLPKALLWAEKSQASADSGQDDLFGLGAAKTLEKPSYDLASEWGLSDKSQKERETLGFYLSAHPIEANKALINAVSSHRLAEWVPQLLAAPAQGWQPRQKALFGAWVSDIRFFKADKSKGDKGRASYKITLNDGEVAVSTWVDAEPWAAYSQRVKVDSLIFVCADVALAPAKDNRPADVRLYNPEFFAPEQIIRDYGTRLELDLRGRFSLKEAETLSQLLKNAPQGTVAVALRYRNALAEGWLDVRQKIQVEADLLDRLNDWLGSERVQLRYRKYQAPISRVPRDSKRFEAAFDE